MIAQTPLNSVGKLIYGSAERDTLCQRQLQLALNEHASPAGETDDQVIHGLITLSLHALGHDIEVQPDATERLTAHHAGGQ